MEKIKVSLYIYFSHNQKLIKIILHVLLVDVIQATLLLVNAFQNLGAFGYLVAPTVACITPYRN